MKFAKNGPLASRAIVSVAKEIPLWGSESGKYVQTAYHWEWHGPAPLESNVGYAVAGPRAGSLFGSDYAHLTLRLLGGKYGCYLLNDAVWDWSGPSICEEDTES